MSTAIDTESDTEIIEALDFDPEVGCEGIGEPPSGCDAHADWFASCRHCGGSIRMLCDPHVQQLRAAAAGWNAVHCPDCLAERPTWDEIVGLSPVKVRS